MMFKTNDVVERLPGAYRLDSPRAGERLIVDSITKEYVYVHWGQRGVYGCWPNSLRIVKSESLYEDVIV